MPFFNEIRPTMRVALYALEGVSLFHVASPLLVFGASSAKGRYWMAARAS